MLSAGRSAEFTEEESMMIMSLVHERILYLDLEEGKERMGVQVAAYMNQKFKTDKSPQEIMAQVELLFKQGKALIETRRKRWKKCNDVLSEFDYYLIDFEMLLDSMEFFVDFEL